jgi:predicted TIM-barrel fold metal-dependent hydrolase
MAGSSYVMLRDQLLDRYGYQRCLLLHDVGQFATHLNPYYSAALCRAVNDWNIDTWMRLDDRLYSVVVAPFATPQEAANEIRRVGGHERMSGVLLAGNPLGRPIGDPLFHPAWQAAAEMGLAVTVHPSTTDRPGPQMGSVGASKARIEGSSQLGQQAMHYISSLIVHGVFEKFPSLNVVITEFGITWLPYVMWRLDQNYDLLRHESPWVKKWPSEYIRKHVRFSTQPIEESPEDKGATAELLKAVDGVEDLLCFSSDYPHYSMDDPTYAARLIPEAWRPKVFFDNACAVYNWKIPAKVLAHSSRGTG